MINNKRMSEIRLIVFTALFLIIFILIMMLSVKNSENKYLRTSLNTTVTQTELNLKNEVQRNKDLAEKLIKYGTMERYEAELYKELADKIYTDVLLLKSVTKAKIKTLIPDSMYPVSNCLVAPKEFNVYGNKTRKKLEVVSNSYLNKGIILYNIILNTPFDSKKKDAFIKTIFTNINLEKAVK